MIASLCCYSVIRLCNLLADRLDIYSLNKHALHDLLSLFELLTELPCSLVILLLPQVVCLIRLNKGCLGVDSSYYLVMSLRLDELLQGLLVKSMVR